MPVRQEASVGERPSMPDPISDIWVVVKSASQIKGRANFSDSASCKLGPAWASVPMGSGPYFYYC